MLFKSTLYFIVALLLTNSCVTEFEPVVTDGEQLLVVQGLITDQPETYSIRLSRSMPVGIESQVKPVSNCKVAVRDDISNYYVFEESAGGVYLSPGQFRGIPGRSYTLHITETVNGKEVKYRSTPMELLPVPAIDSVYYEKTIIREPVNGYYGIHGCRIYLDTHDPANNCRYFRWDYSETWILRLLFSVQNQTCWISEKSKEILIKNTAALDQSLVKTFPVTYITNITDRLRVRYSIEVNQYSLNSDEFAFWEGLRKLSAESGGLYDIIPSSVPGNMYCEDDPDQTVLGYFSVSSKTSKRIFIDEQFDGIIDQYSDCITDTVYGDVNIPGLDTTLWVLFDIPKGMVTPRKRILTDNFGCADCTVRGSNQRPDFWTDENR